VALFVGTHLFLLVFGSTQQMAHDFRLAGTEARSQRKSCAAGTRRYVPSNHAVVTSRYYMYLPVLSIGGTYTIVGT
jgi:hypothetical protein